MLSKITIIIFLMCLVFIFVAFGVGQWALIDKGCNRSAVISFGVFSGLAGAALVGAFL